MFCDKVRGRVKSVLQQWDRYVDEHTDTALKITTALKRALESPVADILTTVVPGEADDILRRRVISALEYAIVALQARDECAGCKDMEARLQCMAAQLRQLPEDVRDALLQKLASLMTGFLDGRRLKQYLYDLYVQAKYTVGKQ